MHPRELWDWSGKTGRGAYVLWGALLIVVKYNLDRILAATLGHKWTPTSYLWPAGTDITRVPEFEWRFFLIMVAVSVPFIWAGTTLTMRRLRDAGWPLWLVALFFVPAVNYIFFFVLALTPARDSAPARLGRTWLVRVIPENPWGSAALSVAVSVPLAVAGTYLAVQVFREYGWGVFIGLPFWVGMVAALVHSYRAPRTAGQCLAVSAMAIVVVGAALIALAFEGLICVLMAAPPATVLALVGGVAGYFIQRRGWGGPPPVEVMGALLLALPGTLLLEHARPQEPPLLRVTTAVEIAATPEQVWPHVIAFHQLDPPTEWYFRTGLAYPVRAEITGTGPGAVRHCVFSTGAFVEPIEVWEEGRLLRFAVTAQPPAMRELSPYPGLRPPHLDHYFSTTRGQFLFVRLPDGRTRLEGTTWYRNRFWPQPYWRLWSDAIIHRIHERVLEHVKRRAEAAPAYGAMRAATK